MSKKTYLGNAMEVSEVLVYPGKRKADAIVGLPTEDRVPNEGEVSFDIKFYLILPKKNRIKLIINLELQKDYYPGYDLVTRAVFYCARMLSAQMEPEILAGEIEGGHRYDLLAVVMIGLNEDSAEKRKTKLHGLLGTLYSGKLMPEEKMDILQKEYGIETTIQMKEGISRMCNLSDAIEERGIRKGIEQGQAQGQALGEQRVNRLIQMLLESSRYEEIGRAVNDSIYQKKLFQEFQL